MIRLVGARLSIEKISFSAVMLLPGTRQIARILALVAVLLASIFQLPLLEAQSRNQFLLASDIHFNPMADPSLVSELAAADPTQWESILSRSKLTAYSQYGQDTNWWLLQSALDQMHATLPHPAFIMVTGDVLAHQFPKMFLNTTHDSDRDHYRAFVLKTVEFLALEFRKRFRNTKILLTPGNDDEDCGNYTIEAGGAFLQDTAGIVRNLAKADDKFENEWKKLGSYNIPHPTIRGLRIISLNTVFLSAKYQSLAFSKGCTSVPSTAASDLLAWLESSLTTAREANEKAWLMFHIPPGIDSYSTMQQYLSLSKSEGTNSAANLCSKAIVPLWEPVWIHQFDELFGRFRNTVIAGFAGHTHTDDFRLIPGAGIKAGFVLIDPPISPIYGQNPAFRVVTFTADGSIGDQSTYYLTNLTLASSKTKGQWKVEYQFSKMWGAKQIDLATLDTLYTRIRSDQSVRDEWLKLYNVSSSAVRIPGDAVQDLYCAIGSLDLDTYQACYCRANAGAVPSVPQH